MIHSSTKTLNVLQVVHSKVLVFFFGFSKFCLVNLYRYVNTTKFKENSKKFSCSSRLRELSRAVEERKLKRPESWKRNASLLVEVSIVYDCWTVTKLRGFLHWNCEHPLHYARHEEYFLSESLRRGLLVHVRYYASMSITSSRPSSKNGKWFSPHSLKQGCWSLWFFFHLLCLIFMLFVIKQVTLSSEAEGRRITIRLENLPIKIFSNEKFYVFDDGFGIRIKQRFTAIIRRHLWQASSNCEATPPRVFISFDNVNMKESIFELWCHESRGWWMSRRVIEKFGDGLFAKGWRSH